MKWAKAFTKAGREEAEKRMVYDEITNVTFDVIRKGMREMDERMKKDPERYGLVKS